VASGVRLVAHGKVRWAILHVPLRDLIADLHHHTQHFR
jgi:hypothetical protein